jgi:hypothetical protein
MKNLEIEYIDWRNNKKTIYSFGINSNYTSHSPEHFVGVQQKLQDSCNERIRTLESEKQIRRSLFEEQKILSRVLNLAKTKGLYPIKN